MNIERLSALLLAWHDRGVSRRKHLLWECAILRHAPFVSDGQTIWQQLPKAPWFHFSHPSREQFWRRRDELFQSIPKVLSDGIERGIEINGHQAIEIIEQDPDLINQPKVGDALAYFTYSEWAAEANMFGYERPVTETDRLQYGIAYRLLFMTYRVMNSDKEFAKWSEYYAERYDGKFYCWGRGNERPYHPQHRHNVLRLAAEIFGSPQAFDQP